MVIHRQTPPLDGDHTTVNKSLTEIDSETWHQNAHSEQNTFSSIDENSNPKVCIGGGESLITSYSGRYLLIPNHFYSIVLVLYETGAHDSLRRVDLNEATISESRSTDVQPLSFENENETSFCPASEKGGQINNGNAFSSRKTFVSKQDADTDDELESLVSRSDVGTKNSRCDHVLARQTGEMVAEKSPMGRFTRFCTKIGTGSYKSVYLALDTNTGQEVAWSVISFAHLTRHERKRVDEEIKLAKQLNSPRIVSFISAWINKEKEEIAFITEMITGGSLRSYIRTRIDGPLKLRVLRKWCLQILEGIDYLHNSSPSGKPIIHRDLKCDNIFINGSDGNVLIGDLGLCVDLAKMERSIATSIVGTPEFMAPELFTENYGTKVDIYAFGMSLLELITRDYPYAECQTPGQVYLRVMKGELPNSVERIANQQLRNIVKSCLSSDPEERPTVKELMDNEFWTTCTDGNELAIIHEGVNNTGPGCTSRHYNKYSCERVPEKILDEFQALPSNGSKLPKPNSDTPSRSLPIQGDTKKDSKTISEGRLLSVNYEARKKPPNNEENATNDADYPCFQKNYTPGDTSREASSSTDHPIELLHVVQSINALNISPVFDPPPACQPITELESCPIKDENCHKSCVGLSQSHVISKMLASPENATELHDFPEDKVKNKRREEVGKGQRLAAKDSIFRKLSKEVKVIQDVVLVAEDFISRQISFDFDFADDSTHSVGFEMIKAGLVWDDIDVSILATKIRNAVLHRAWCLGYISVKGEPNQKYLRNPTTILPPISPARVTFHQPDSVINTTSLITNSAMSFPRQRTDSGSDVCCGCSSGDALESPPVYNSFPSSATPVCDETSSSPARYLVDHCASPRFKHDVYGFHETPLPDLVNSSPGETNFVDFSELTTTPSYFPSDNTLAGSTTHSAPYYGTVQIHSDCGMLYESQRQYNPDSLLSPEATCRSQINPAVISEYLPDDICVICESTRGVIEPELLIYETTDPTSLPRKSKMYFNRIENFELVPSSEELNNIDECIGRTVKSYTVIEAVAEHSTGQSRIGSIVSVPRELGVDDDLQSISVRNFTSDELWACDLKGSSPDLTQWGYYEVCGSNDRNMNFEAIQESGSASHYGSSVKANLECTRQPAPATFKSHHVFGIPEKPGFPLTVEGTNISVKNVEPSPSLPSIHQSVVEYRDQTEWLQKVLSIFVPGVHQNDFEMLGIYCTKTEETLKYFQIQHGLRPDGVCDEKTWNCVTREFENKTEKEKLKVKQREDLKMKKLEEKRMRDIAAKVESLEAWGSLMEQTMVNLEPKMQIEDESYHIGFNELNICETKDKVSDPRTLPTYSCSPSNAPNFIPMDFTNYSNALEHGEISGHGGFRPCREQISLTIQTDKPITQDESVHESLISPLISISNNLELDLAHPEDTISA